MLSFREKLKDTPLLPWLLLGLFVRLLFMPFTFHGDLLSVYGRAYLILEKGSLIVFGLNVINFLHAIFLFLLKPFLPYQTLFSQYNLMTFTDNDSLGFINQPGIFSALFFFKLPYLLFEILVLAVLFKIFARSPIKDKVIKFWLFNPVIIFSTYIFGRFEIIVILLLFLALWAAKLNRPYWAVAALGVASVLRLYPIILILPFAFILSQQKKERGQLFFLGVAPLFFSLIVESFSQQKATYLKQITEMTHLSYPLAMKFSLGITPYDNLYIFIFAYCLILFYLLIKPQTGFESILKFSLYVMLLFFATSFFHPHYFSWLLPFLIFFIGDNSIVNFHWLQVVSWLVYTFQWGRALAAYLIAPLSPAFFWSLPAPIELIDKILPAAQVIGVGRSVFTATCLVIAYLVYKQKANLTLAEALAADSSKQDENLQSAESNQVPEAEVKT